LPVLAFLIRRAISLVITLWAIFTLTFFLMRAVPGGPLDQERKLEPHLKANLEARYHLDEPVIQQYWRELSNFARGDFGLSYKMGDFTVNQIIAQSLPVSALLGLLALSFALVVGVTAGVLAASWRRSGVDIVLMGLATVGIALPNFVVASLAIMVFVFWFGLLPAAGWGSISDLILPSICLGLPYAAYIARLTRTGMLDVLSQDYIRTAYAKGLPAQLVVMRHALRGAMVPIVSFLGPATAGILTGSPVVEQIFAIPGMGRHIVESALQRDLTLSMGLVLVYTVILFVTNTIVDLSYGLLDPRVKLE